MNHSYFFVVDVYDIPLFCNPEETVAKVIKTFHSKFEIFIDEEISKFLGISVEESGDMFQLHKGSMVHSHLE